MNPEFLLAHFDRISAAPDAIPKLRGFILDLAVQGRLVDQDPTDEPALELLKRIQTQKTRLLNEGKIKRHDPSREISASEIDYPLPPKWEPTRIGNLLTVIRGASPRPKGDPKYFSTERTPYHWIKISDIRKHSKDRVLCDTDEFLTKAGMEKSVLLPKGTLVVTNSATIGVPIFLGFEGGCIHDGYLAFPYFPTSELSKDFFFVLFQTLQSYAAKKARGMAQLNLNTELVREFPLGLPPFAEQQRIVAKVDELMALCDRLEAARRARESQRDRLTAASHHHLNNGANAEGFRKHAHFCLNHFPRLTTLPEQIPALRSTILSLGVRGQLVPQNPSDEPASELLKRIQVEKTRLTQNGHIKKDKRAWEGLPKDPPHELPAAWIWTCLQDVFEISRGGSPRPAGDPRYFGGPIPWITVREITKDGEKYLTSTEGGLTEEGATRSRFIESGDLLLTNSGATLGVPKISHIKACMNDGVAVLRLFHSVPLNDFAYLYLHSQTDAFRRVNQGMGQPNLNTPIIAGWFFPLPPLAEQHRIVAKVDELMAVCDRLEAQLTTAQAESSRLLESVLHNALTILRCTEQWFLPCSQTRPGPF